MPAEDEDLSKARQRCFFFALLFLRMFCEIGKRQTILNVFAKE